MNRLKYIKLENEDGSYSSSIPLAVDSDYVNINGNTLTNELNNKATKAEVQSLASGSPLVASSISDMADTSRVYVNTTDGHWYYYNGNAWTDGGIYQATSIQTDFDNLMNNINLPNKQLYGNKINEYAFDYRVRFENNYTETLGKMTGYSLTTFLPTFRTNAEDLALGLINIDFELPLTGKITFKRATVGTFQFYLYKENGKGHTRDVGTGDAGWGDIIGYTFNDDGTITLDCAKVRTKFQGGYDHCLAILDKNDRIMYSDEYQIPLPNYLKNIKLPTVLTVKNDNTGDYSNLRGVTEFINAHPIPQGYEVHIYPGIYDVLSDYSTEEINAAEYLGDASKFCGILIGDNVKLKGIGSKENIILKGELNNTTYSDSIRTQISTLNLVGNCELENLTITSKYIRYAIHDDFYDNEDKTHIINNCNIINILATNAVSRGVAYGLGTKSGQFIQINNTEINPTLGYHNNTGFTKIYEVELNNCKIPGYIGINDANSTVDGYLTLNGCDVSYIQYTLGNGLAKQYTQLKGNSIINVPILSNTNLIKYTFGNVKEATIANYYSIIGKCVRRYTLTGYAQASDSGKNFDGIYIFEKDGIKYVQTSGYIQTNMLGNTPMQDWEIGNYLKVGNDGYLTKTTNLSDAVAIVALSQNNNLFIKLL